GYNSIAGESYDDDDNLPKESKMCYKPKWQRLLILVAGVTMNFILAFIVLFFIGLGGVPSQDNVITSVESGSPAEIAGLKSGDQILKLNNHKIDTWYYLSIVSLLKNNNEYYSYEVKHADGVIETVNIKPLEVIQDEKGNIYNITEENKEEDIIKEHNFKEGEYTKTKIIGIRGSDKNEYGIRNALKYAFKRFVTISRSMYLIIGSLFTGSLSLDALSGPVGMYSVVEKVGHTGFANIAYLAAYLSINLGIMNILPFPAFDGGHVLFVLIELITRKRVNEKFEAVCHFIGFILIFTLMILITFKDVIRLIG
nr:RIP metalloprotease RseP [Bacilli bacterium]